MRWMALVLTMGCGGGATGDTGSTATASGTSSGATPSGTTSTTTPSTGTPGGTTSSGTPTGTSSTADPCAGRTVGTSVGDCALDFTLIDRDGVSYTLSDYAGSVIVVDFSAMWCPICQGLAPEGQQFWTDHQGQDLVYLTALFQDVGGGDVDAGELTQWIDAYGLTHPVLTDPGHLVYDEYDAGYQPTIAVIDRDFTITWIDAGTSARNGYEAEVLALL